MPLKDQGKIVHRTAKGREFNMDQLRQKNELAPAVGNIKVNARGDELGPGGRIIKRRTELLDEYYKSQTKDEEVPVKQPATVDTSKQPRRQPKMSPTPKTEPDTKNKGTTTTASKSTTTTTGDTAKNEQSN